MKRRQFLRNTAAASALPMMLSGFPLQAIGREHLLQSLMGCETDRVLVLIQLNGGNDGLNTLIPLDQYSRLAAARSNVLIPDRQVLAITPETGLHPAMTGVKNLFDAGKAGVLQAVGYPDPNFSHFRSTDIWTTASPSNEAWTTGWLGRYLDSLHGAYPTGYPNGNFPDPLAITIGSVVSGTCQGPAANFSMAIPSVENFAQLLSGGVAAAPNTPYGHELTYLRQSIQQTNQYLTTIQAAAQAANNLSALYPTGNRLADQLKIVARLIAGGLKTPFYIVSLGGFDTHANQVDLSDNTLGDHADLLRTLSDAVFAFQDDLRLHSVEDRVVGMTFSEFGRRIASNGSRGTDHGAAAPLFVFGTKVNPRIHGQNPGIPAQVAVNDNIPMQFDFRSVYGSILEDWFCVDPSDIRNLLFQDYQHLPVLNTPSTSVDPSANLSFGLEVFPNPVVEGSARLRFSTEAGGRVMLSLFDGQGRNLRSISDQQFAPGTFELSFDMSSLPAGAYYLRLQHQHHVETRVLMKQ